MKINDSKVMFYHYIGGTHCSPDIIRGILFSHLISIDIYFIQYYIFSSGN